MKKLSSSFGFLFNLPTPSSISMLWNFGFMLGLVLSVQLISGFVLSMSFVAFSEEAFFSVVHIMRDVNCGWIVRFFHSGAASLFFVLIFFHIFRGFYFGSFSSKSLTWVIGVLILLVTMAVAFFGYVLPWGQMSYWGATVITNLVSAVPYFGKALVNWMWGDFSVSQPTLNRFFSVHFILPFVIAVLSVSHIISLHFTGYSNPLGGNEMVDKLEFSGVFVFKDAILMVVVFFLLGVLIMNNPFLFMDTENMNHADPMKAPSHIKPEWYFLFAYAILRSVPSKLGGVVALALSVLVLFFLGLKTLSLLSSKFSPTRKVFFCLFILSFLMLTYVGGSPVEYPYFDVGKIYSVLYFLSLF